MKLPFVYWYDAADIPSKQYSLLGSLNIRSLNDLKHANAAADKVSISVFAWMEDVHLDVPTSNTINSLPSQAGSLDEYGNGPVSAPANAIAASANALSSIPLIAPYARASEMAASGIAKLAQMFGLSRPAQIENIVEYTPRYMGDLATTKRSDAVTKMTFDPKQEVSIDSRVVGLSGNDEMSFKSLTQRESYYTTFTWGEAETPSSLLFNCYVNPMLVATATPGTDTEHHCTALAYATAPFCQWRGTINYRIQVVASAFHKGRLRVTWDPIDNFSTSNSYAQTYSRIIDIAEEKDVTIGIGWGSEKPFLLVDDFVGATGSNEGVYLGPDTLHSNGVMIIEVLTELTSPNSTINNDVEVNVFVSGGDDYEIVDPFDEIIAKYSLFQPQFGELDDRLLHNQAGDLDGADDENAESPPVEEQVVEVLGSVPRDSNLYRVFYGDPVFSVAQIIKRYCYHSAYLASTATNGLGEIDKPDFPFYRGFDPLGINSAGNSGGTLSPYNFANNTYLNWFTPLYVCRRGGIRHKYIASGTDTGLTMFFAKRTVPSATYDHRLISGSNYRAATIDTAARGYVVLNKAGTSGNIVTPYMNNPVLEVEFPYHTPYRFYAARSPNMLENSFDTTYHSIYTFSENDRCYVRDFVAAADDFSLSFFIGAPVLFDQTTPSAS